MSDDARFRKGFLLALVVAITAAFVFVVRDFLMTIFVAAIFSGLAHPLYSRLLKAFGRREALASSITLLIIVLLIGVPLVFIVSIVINEAVRMTDNVTPFVRQLVNEPTSIDAYLDRVPGIKWLAPYREMLLMKVGETAGSLGKMVVSSLTSTTRGTLALIVDFFLMLYAMFFFLIKGRRYLDSMLQYLPLRESEQNQMLQRFVSVARATIKGTLLIGMVQGALGGLIFAILGISGAVLWGLLMIVLSLLPMVGGALVWVPAAIYLLIIGHTWQAIFVLVYGALVLGSMDNVVRFVLAKKMADVHPIVTVLGVILGLKYFGFLGLIFGPLVISYFIILLKIYYVEYQKPVLARPAKKRQLMPVYMQPFLGIKRIRKKPVPPPAKTNSGSKPTSH